MTSRYVASKSRATTVGHIAGARGPIEQARDLAVGVFAKDAMQSACVLGVHIDDVVPLAILRTAHLARAVRSHGDPDFPQLSHGAAMWRVADLLARGGGGSFDGEVILEPRAPHELLERELCHGGTADAPVADNRMRCIPHRTFERVISRHSIAEWGWEHGTPTQTICHLRCAGGESTDLAVVWAMRSDCMLASGRSGRM